MTMYRDTNDDIAQMMNILACIQDAIRFVMRRIFCMEKRCKGYGKETLINRLLAAFLSTFFTVYPGG